MTANQFTTLAALLRSSPLESDRIAADLLDACAPLGDIDWPCETCEGTHQVWNDPATDPLRRHFHIDCPDCVDGQTPPAVRVRKLIAEHARIWKFPVAARTVSINGPDYTEGWVHCIEHLRDVGR